MRQFRDNWHITAICQHLEMVSRGEVRNLIINIPPRHMKSLLVSVFWPCWMWIKFPEKRWLFSSYAQTLSVRDSLKCRRILESSWYRKRWGDSFILTSDQNQKTRFENSRTGARIATSVEGSATGEGGDFVVVDDPHNVKERESDVKREAVLQWWDEVMSTRLNDPQTGSKVIVMQRVHEGDLTGHVLKQGGYTHLCIPAEYDKSRASDYDPRTEPGELLWPDRFSPIEIADAKIRLGSLGYAGQFQQRPAPEEGGLAKRRWWRFWNGDLPTKFDEVVASWDMAFKDLEGNSFVVGQVWGRVQANKYLLDQVRRRMDFVETLRAVESLAQRWPDATRIYVEDKANGPAVISSLRDRIPGIIPVEPDGSKIARASAVTPDIEAGNVFLPDPELMPWVDDYIHEWASAPNGEYWDQIDTTSQALRKLGRTQPFFM